MKTTKLILGAAAVLFIAVAVRAAEAPKSSPALVEKGKADFAKYCASCHGPKGEGDGPAAKALRPPPRNLVTDPLKGGATVAGVHTTLETGVKGTAMVPFKHLPDEDRWALSYYVLSLRGGAKK